MMTNEQLRAMATVALETWWLELDVLYGEACRKGLQFLAADGDWEDQSIIDAHVSGPSDWDGLEIWAIYLGS